MDVNDLISITSSLFGNNDQSTSAVAVATDERLSACMKYGPSRNRRCTVTIIEMREKLQAGIWRRVSKTGNTLLAQNYDDIFDEEDNLLPIICCKTCDKSFYTASTTHAVSHIEEHTQMMRTELREKKLLREQQIRKAEEMKRNRTYQISSAQLRELIRAKQKSECINPNCNKLKHDYRELVLTLNAFVESLLANCATHDRLVKSLAKSMSDLCAKFGLKQRFPAPPDLIAGDKKLTNLLETIRLLCQTNSNFTSSTQSSQQSESNSASTTCGHFSDEYSDKLAAVGRKSAGMPPAVRTAANGVVNSAKIAQCAAMLMRRCEEPPQQRVQQQPKVGDASRFRLCASADRPHKTTQHRHQQSLVTTSADQVPQRLTNAIAADRLVQRRQQHASKLPINAPLAADGKAPAGRPHSGIFSSPASGSQSSPALLSAANRVGCSPPIVHSPISSSAFHAKNCVTQANGNHANEYATAPGTTTRKRARKDYQSDANPPFNTSSNAQFTPYCKRPNHNVDNDDVIVVALNGATGDNNNAASRRDADNNTARAKGASSAGKPAAAASVDVIVLSDDEDGNENGPSSSAMPANAAKKLNNDVQGKHQRCPCC